MHRVQGKDSRHTLATSFLDAWRSGTTSYFTPYKNGYDTLLTSFVIFLSFTQYFVFCDRGRRKYWIIYNEISSINGSAKK